MSTTAQKTLEVTDLGLMAYEVALVYQRDLRERRIRGEASDTLLLVEHPPVVTLGSFAKAEHLLSSEESLARSGVALHRVERGGDVTLHCPGQLVGYPILLLEGADQDVRRYVWRLEQTVIDTLNAFGLQASRRQGTPGVWVGERKVAALGVHLRRWVTLHGFSLNVDPDLGLYQHIVPCGLAGVGVTSLARELGQAPRMAQVKALVVAAFTRQFGYAGPGGPVPVAGYEFRPTS